MFKDRFILLTTVISLVLLQIMLWALFLNWDQLPPQVPFNYLAPWGTARLALPAYLWYLPTLGGIFLALNLVWSYYFFRREKIVAQLAALAVVFLNLVLTFSLLRILSLLGFLTVVI